MTATPIRNIAVTGATGFIGGAIARSLLRSGYQVRTLVRPTSNAKVLPQGIECIVGSFQDKSSIESLLRSVDAVVHCAGAVRGTRRQTFLDSNAKVVGLLAHSAALENSVDRFLLVSSLASTEPELSPYAQSKRAGELALCESSRDMKWLALRAPAVYGPGDQELMPLFKAMSRGFVPVWGNRNARFSLLFIADLVTAVEKWLSSAIPACGIYELHDGCSDGYTLDDVIGIGTSTFQRRIYRVPVAPLLLDLFAAVNLQLGRLLGYEPMLTPWKLNELRHQRWVCDNGDFTAASGWEPRILLAEGLGLTLNEDRAVYR
ncbi:MAG: epimerase [Legionellales bacterium]|nr:epimerase [Legionellales bacterium]HCU90763.1 epimerase [Gammaproteobacteria bacterium]